MIDYLNDGISGVDLVDKMIQDFPLKVVNAARISYNKRKDKFDEKDKDLCKFLYSQQHTSPFRHSYYTFHIKLPLFVARQLTKYQVGSTFRSYELNGEEVSLEAFDWLFDEDKGCSWNEISGRYTKTSNQYYIPHELRSNPPHGNKQSSSDYSNPLHFHDINFRSPETIISEMVRRCEDSLKFYDTLVKNGVAREIARMYLPQALYTEVYWTVSLQSILHFLSQRCTNESQLEIRLLAESIKTLIKDDLDKIGAEV